MRKKRQSGSSKGGGVGAPLQWATLAVCCAVLVVALLSLRGRSRAGERIDDRIGVAVALVNRGIPAEAITEYEAALDLARGDKARKAKLCYLIGKTYLEPLKDYERALAYLIRAEYYGLEGTERGQAERWIVECMERTGRSLDASNRIKRTTSLHPNRRSTSGVVVAQIGDRRITMADLDAEIRALPPYLQKQYTDPNKKAEFLDEYVAKQLLVGAAERANLNHDPKVLQELDRMRNEILVRAYYQREIEGKVSVTPDEVKMYYDAHKDEYLKPAEFVLSHIELADKAAATSAVAALKGGKDFAALAREISENKTTRDKGGRIGRWDGQGALPAPLANDPALRKAVAALEKGKWTEPIKTASGKFEIVRADDVSTPTPRPFEDVQALVESRLRREKITRRQRETLDRLRKAEKVTIFSDAFKGAKSSK